MGQSNVDEEDDEAEWERFQKKLNKREKALEGKSKVSHSVHSPYFTDDKQEFWWCYISDRKNHALITPPIHVTGLVEREEVELKFTAPAKPGRVTMSSPRTMILMTTTMTTSELKLFKSFF